VRGIFGCLVDEHPRSHLDAFRWFGSLTRVAGVAPRDLVVVSTSNNFSDVLQYMQSAGVTVRRISAEGTAATYPSRAVAELASTAPRADGYVALTGHDVAIIEDPRRLVLPEKSIGITLVAGVLPPPVDLIRVFAEAGLTTPAFLGEQQESSGSVRDSAGELGLVLIPSALLPATAGLWEHWTRFLAEQPLLPEPYSSAHSQTGLLLAAAAADIDLIVLDNRWNVSLDDASPTAAPADPPAMIHYHDRVDATGLLKPVGVPLVDERIAAVNGAVRDLWQNAFPNATFWEWRYRTNPQLGSGIGSRGDSLREKRRLLAALISALRPVSVLDVGCGDGEATRGLPIPQYVGIDLSPEAIQRARRTRPTGEFLVGTVADHPVSAELTICLDVLIHQSSRNGYEKLVQRLLESTSGFLLLSGYERPPAKSPMVHFHEPLSSTLRRLSAGAKIYHLDNRHGMSTVIVAKLSGGRTKEWYRQYLRIRRIQLQFAVPQLRRALRMLADRHAFGWLVRNSPVPRFRPRGRG